MLPVSELEGALGEEQPVCQLPSPEVPWPSLRTTGVGTSANGQGSWQRPGTQLSKTVDARDLVQQQNTSSMTSIASHEGQTPSFTSEMRKELQFLQSELRRFQQGMSFLASRLQETQHLTQGTVLATSAYQQSGAVVQLVDQTVTGVVTHIGLLVESMDRETAVIDPARHAELRAAVTTGMVGISQALNDGLPDAMAGFEQDQECILMGPRNEATATPALEGQPEMTHKRATTAVHSDEKEAQAAVVTWKARMDDGQREVAQLLLVHGSKIQQSQDTLTQVREHTAVAEDQSRALQFNLHSLQAEVVVLQEQVDIHAARTMEQASKFACLSSELQQARRETSTVNLQADTLQSQVHELGMLLAAKKVEYNLTESHRQELLVQAELSFHREEQSRERLKEQQQELNRLREQLSMNAVQTAEVKQLQRALEEFSEQTGHLTKDLTSKLELAEARAVARDQEMQAAQQEYDMNLLQCTVTAKAQESQLQDLAVALQEAKKESQRATEEAEVLKVQLCSSIAHQDAGMQASHAELAELKARTQQLTQELTQRAVERTKLLADLRNANDAAVDTLAQANALQTVLTAREKEVESLTSAQGAVLKENEQLRVQLADFRIECSERAVQHQRLSSCKKLWTGK